MRVSIKSFAKAFTLVAVGSIAAPALANSTFVTNPLAGTLTATANLDFTIIVPRMLYLRVGTAAAALTSTTTIDNIVYTGPGANNGDGTVIAGVGGDLTAGAVTARLVGNGGPITLSSTTLGALSNGAGDTISYSQISTAVAALVSATALPHPTLVDGASTALTITPAGGSKVVNRDAKWTFTYLNTGVAGAGTFGGVNVQNGRVTYTASMP